MLKLPVNHRARGAFGLSVSALCQVQAQSINIIFIKKEEKSPILESVSFLNHSKPSVLKTFQLPAQHIHSPNFRLIFYAAFKVHRKYIDIRDVPSLDWILWEMSEDRKHLNSPETLQRFIWQGNENEH